MQPHDPLREHLYDEPIEEEEYVDVYSSADKYTSYKKDGGDIVLSELLVDASSYYDTVKELYQHKRPSLLGMFLKPGFFVVFLFWFFYLTGITYYSGRDKKRRCNMTKRQNRDDLAEVVDKDLQ